MTQCRSALLCRQDKAAFTLAEVLITLAIIGVVAAITLSTVISKIQDRQNIAKWKTVYSQINNAFNKVYFENKDTYRSETNVGDNWWSYVFIKELVSKFEVIDKCGRRLGYKDCDNRKQKYFGNSEASSTLYKTLAGGTLNAYDFNTSGFLLKNGAAIYVGGSHSGPTILVDVNNASAGPNVLGRDVFAITCIPRWTCSKLIPMGSVDTTHGATNYMYNNRQIGTCSKDVGLAISNYLYNASGAGCAAKYLME